MMNRKVMALLINSVMESPHCALKSAIYRHCNAALQISTVKSANELYRLSWKESVIPGHTIYKLALKPLPFLEKSIRHI